MTPQTFHLFPNLPPELRNKIYALTLNPRLLPIYSTSTPNPLRAQIPSLLHTCQESRLVLIASGYRLAFSCPIPKAGSEEGDNGKSASWKQWFNPEIDTVFPVELETVYEYSPQFHLRRVFDDTWFETRFSVEDAKSVRRLAVLGSCTPQLAANRARWDTLLRYLRFFGGIESVEVVESIEFVGVLEWMNSERGFLESFKGVELRCMEVGREEVGGWVNGLASGVICKRFSRAVREWVLGGREESAFLGHCYGKLETVLRAEREKEREKAEWTVPSVRSVQVVTGWGRRMIERHREKYWEFKAERERIDVMRRHRDRPASPFTEMFEDEMEVIWAMSPER
jgi:hypothetical protein